MVCFGISILVHALMLTGWVLKGPAYGVRRTDSTGPPNTVTLTLVAEPTGRVRPDHRARRGIIRERADVCRKPILPDGQPVAPDGPPGDLCAAAFL